MYLSIIIPAYNEEQRIEKTLRSIDAYTRKQPYDYEIIVVNDGSTDCTVDVVTLLSFTIRNMRLISNPENHGKGYVVRQGMLEAKGFYRLFMDADGSTPMSEIEKLMPFAERGADIVISSRRTPDAVVEIEQNPVREFLGAVFRLIVHIIVPVGVTDTQNGFKLFTARAAEEIFRRQETPAWAFDVEVLAIARMFGFSVREVGIHWINDDRSRMTFKGMVRMVFEVIHIRFNLWYGMYDRRLDAHLISGRV